MDNHFKRIAAAFVIGILVLTAVFIVLPKTGLVITAYLFSLLAPTFLLIVFWRLASGTKQHYITDAAFPIQAFRYTCCNLACSVIFVFLEQINLWKIPVGVFALLQIIIVAVFTWLILAMDAGQEEILLVEERVRKKTFDWKLLQADIETIKGDAPAEYRKDIQAVIDAVRYADPMTCPEVADIEEAIRDNVLLLENKIQNGTADEVAILCAKIQKQIKNRNNRIRLFK